MKFYLPEFFGKNISNEIQLSSNTDAREGGKLEIVNACVEEILFHTSEKYITIVIRL